MHESDNGDTILLQGLNEKAGLNAVGDGVFQAKCRNQPRHEAINLIRQVLYSLRQADHSCRLLLEGGEHCSASPQQYNNIVLAVEPLGDVPSQDWCTSSRCFVYNDEDRFTV